MVLYTIRPMISVHAKPIWMKAATSSARLPVYGSISSVILGLCMASTSPIPSGDSWSFGSSLTVLARLRSQAAAWLADAAEPSKRLLPQETLVRWHLIGQFVYLSMSVSSYSMSCYCLGPSRPVFSIRRSKERKSMSAYLAAWSGPRVPLAEPSSRRLHDLAEKTVRVACSI